MMMTPLDRALDQFDGKATHFAKAIGAPQQLVSYWLKSPNRRVGAQYVHAASEVTGIPPHELRPDIFPPPEPAAVANVTTANKQAAA